MNLYEKIIRIYPELEIKEFDQSNPFISGDIRLQNDLDEKGEYIAKWNHPTLPKTYRGAVSMSMAFDGTNGLVFPDNSTQPTAARGFGFKNRIINGAMQIWQRGTSFSLSAGQTYTADRFITVINGSGSTSTLSQQATTPSDILSLGVQDPQYFARYAVTVAGSVTYRDFAQRIEDVRTFAGQNATISFYAKAASSMTVGVQLYQGFGSGGSPDASTTPVNVTIGTTWQRYTVTIACPSVSGKTIGAGSMVAAVLILPNTTFTFDVTMIQAEYGSKATPFDYRPYGTELQLCQRYFQVLKSSWAVGTSTTAISGILPFYQELRAAPTLGKINNNIKFGDRVAVGNGSSSTPTISSDDSVSREKQIGFNLGGFSGFTTRNMYIQEVDSTNTGLFTVSAEL